MSNIENTDIGAGGYGFDVARGLIPGSGCFTSLGERESLNQKVQGVDIWRGTADTIPEPPDVGEQMTVVSDDAGDALAGTGVQTVRIEYLDAAGVEKTEDIDLNGLTGVNTIATDIRFVNAMYAVAVGSNGVAEGNITIHQTGTPATVYNLIYIGGNMSLTVARMIPAGKSFYLTRWTATSTTQNQQVAIRIRATQRDGVLIQGVYLFIDSVIVEVDTYEHTFSCPIRIPALAKIKVSAWPNQVGTDVSATFDGILLED